MASIRERFREAIASFLDENKAILGNSRVLVAVSGGADSVFLITLLQSIGEELDLSIAAATVNHRLRANEEGAKDADFVESLCASFNPPVKCFRVDLEAGAVKEEALRRKMGLEEAARFLRYQALESLRLEWRASCIMTAHTASDQLETLLMRFIQGAGAVQSAGILPLRDFGEGSLIFRPMLAFYAEEVRSFLKSAGISWREDSSNSDTRFLRNNIRLNLFPFLDKNFAGWRKAALAGAEKSAMDLKAIESLPLPEWKPFLPDSGNSLLVCSADEYKALLPALRLRFLYKGAALLGMEGRVPYRLLRQMVYSDYGKVNGAGVFFERGGKLLFFGRDIVYKRKKGYLIIVRGECSVPLPFGEIRVLKAGNGGLLAVKGALGQMLFKPPIVIRSRVASDFIIGKNGMRKSLKELFSEWGVPSFLRDCVPVLETAHGISAILGSSLGFLDFAAEMQNEGLWPRTTTI